MRLNILHTCAAAILSILLAATVSADSSLPEVSHDGLHLLKNTKLRAVYMKPGANLEITAPDVMSAGMQQNFSADAGQMTLYMQLYDGKTGDIIARIIDPEAAGDEAFEVRNSVTNMADAERILRRWATILSSHLETVSAATSASQ